MASAFFFACSVGSNAGFLVGGSLLLLPLVPRRALMGSGSALPLVRADLALAGLLERLNGAGVVFLERSTWGRGCLERLDGAPALGCAEAAFLGVGKPHGRSMLVRFWSGNDEPTDWRRDAPIEERRAGIGMADLPIGIDVGMLEPHCSLPVMLRTRRRPGQRGAAIRPLPRCFLCSHRFMCVYYR